MDIQVKAGSWIADVQRQAGATIYITLALVTTFLIARLIASWSDYFKQKLLKQIYKPKES
ncbi:uncharacterized protein N7482_010396 [Penicillium canariense]|uniref:Uncharacterized protein n=1 Tax=Penicillium canariense TaxID=189055 RepID=A0A9W9HLF8_9EURO|nr:uncharacterized protein N7482_010396 [Penicillium canariense]KAJ5151144.1 hypothetical protein N7482_010396 [Penicillium canariense]